MFQIGDFVYSMDYYEDTRGVIIAIEDEEEGIYYRVQFFTPLTGGQDSLWFTGQELQIYEKPANTSGFSRFVREHQL